VTGEQLLDAASAEVAVVIGALLDAPTTVEVSTMAVNVRWTVSLTMAGTFGASVILGFDADGSEALARQLMALGPDEVPTDASVTDTLVEVCAQALSAVGQREGFTGLRLVEAKIVPDPPMMEPASVQLRAGDTLSMSIAGWAVLEAGAPAAKAPVTALSRPSTAPAIPAPANLDLILDIELPLTVRFGETEMTLLALTRLAPGSIIDLGRSPDEPVDVLVNGRLVARGDVVVVSGNYGVRIVEVISAADRLKTVAA
jgi:flagellar motor switch protein FliN/FliY